MKKLLSFLLIFSIFVPTIWAYDLTDKDQVIVQRASVAIEKMIIRKWENYRAKYVIALQKLQLRFQDNPRMQKIISETANVLSDDTSGLENVFITADSSVNLPTADTSISFSDTQINDILAKTEVNMNNQIKIKDSSTRILVQWDFKAEYIAPKDYWKDYDKIVVTLSWMKYELPWVYGKEEMKKYLDAIKKWQCGSESTEKSEWMVLVNNKYYPSPSSWDCIMQWSFSNFEGFSPSWFYLMYTTHGYENGSTKMVDSKTGKSVIEMNSMLNVYTWTSDNKQFIYWTSPGMESPGFGLYITKKWNFPAKTLIQNSNEARGLYVDQKYIYVNHGMFNGTDNNVHFLNIYSLSTFKEVFSKEIK